MKHLSTTRALIAGGLAAFLLSCETPMEVAAPAPPPAPPMLIQIPPPPPPPPAIQLSGQIVELASNYRAVMTSASAITANFTNNDDVARAVQTGSAYEQVQLQQGAIAYAAITALQQPEYVSALREFARSRQSREEIAARLLANPQYVYSLPHVDKAAGLAIGAIDGTGAQVMVAGRAVKQSAYDVQRQAWSKATIADNRARLDLTRTLSTTRRAAPMDDVAMLREATEGKAALSLSGAPVTPPYSPVITRGLAVAAMAAIGMAGDDYMAAVAPLLDEPGSADCLNMSKLNLYQCLAVSGPQYEHIFCLGQHAMMDTGQCMIQAANSPTPAFVPPPPPPPAPKPAPKAAPKARR